MKLQNLVFARGSELIPIISFAVTRSLLKSLFFHPISVLFIAIPLLLAHPSRFHSFSSPTFSQAIKQ
jgi:hypothetical protein